MIDFFEDPDFIGQVLLEAGVSVDTGHWQSLKGVPHTKTIELMNLVFQLGIPRDREDLASIVKPNLPWAEDHFQERVSGKPTNPGNQYMNWPWYDPSWAAQKFKCKCGMEYEGHQDEGYDCQGCGEPMPPFDTRQKQFSHTYQERMWPRWAEHPKELPDPDGFQFQQGENRGIRFRYGDLNDVVQLLAREPHTRQAYLPIWFPEDTGAHHNERVPCTLGYHFLLRDNKLHINYFIRSCDFLRYFRDDVYMAARLCQWVLGELQDLEEGSQEPGYTAEHGGDMWLPGDLSGDGVTPGTLTMFISSLHIFEGDLPKMRREYG